MAKYEAGFFIGVIIALILVWIVEKRKPHA